MPRVTQQCPEGTQAHGFTAQCSCYSRSRLQEGKGQGCAWRPCWGAGLTEGSARRFTPPWLQFNSVQFHCPHHCAPGDSFLPSWQCHWCRGYRGKWRTQIQLPHCSPRAFALVVPFVWRDPTSSPHTCTCVPMLTYMHARACMSMRAHMYGQSYL